MQLVEEYLQPLVDSGDIRNVFSISGQGGSANSGFMVLTLAPWGERQRTQAEIVQRHQPGGRPGAGAARQRHPVQQPAHPRRRQRPADGADRQ